MQIVFGMLFFLGLGLLGLGILAVSAFRSRSATAVIVWGLIAMALMALETVFLTAMAGIGSATSTSQAGYKVVSIAVIVFLLSLVIYFPFAFARLGDKKQSENEKNNKA